MSGSRAILIWTQRRRIRFLRVAKNSLAGFQKALLGFKGLAGRMEFVQKEPFCAIVDGAHTPDSLEKAYENARPEIVFGKTSGKMICILGSAGGGRDIWKRPAMGKIMTNYCDTIILSNEDPYDEDPGEILEQIKYGIDEAENGKAKPENVMKILDRRKAIAKAVSLAEKGGVIIATGKGSEASIHIAKGKAVPWNEKEAFKEVLGL